MARITYGEHSRYWTDRKHSTVERFVIGLLFAAGVFAIALCCGGA